MGPIQRQQYTADSRGSVPTASLPVAAMAAAAPAALWRQVTLFERWKHTHPPPNINYATESAQPRPCSSETLPEHSRNHPTMLAGTGSGVNRRTLLGHCVVHFARVSVFAGSSEHIHTQKHRIPTSPYSELNALGVERRALDIFSQQPGENRRDEALEHVSRTPSGLFLPPLCSSCPCCCVSSRPGLFSVHPVPAFATDVDAVNCREEPPRPLTH